MKKYLILSTLILANIFVPQHSKAVVLRPMTPAGKLGIGLAIAPLAIPAMAVGLVISVTHSLAHNTKKIATNWFGSNTHEVIPGKLIRSGTFKPEALMDIIDQHQIKTIINLRGAQESKAWWQKEKRIAELYGIKHYDINLSSERVPSKTQLKEIFRIYNESVGPVLVHSETGKNRAGLISALLEFESYKSKELARAQLSLKYGYIKTLHPEMGVCLEEWFSLRSHLNFEEACAAYDPQKLGYRVSV